MGKMIETTRSDGKKLSGYAAEVPGRKDAPAVIVIQEWWGLRDELKRFADQLGAAGYHAFVPDLYRGHVAKNSDEAQKMMQAFDWGDAVKDLVASAEGLRRYGAHKVASLGFCMGGALSVLAGLHAGVDAVITFYGVPPADGADPSQLKCPLQGHFAEIDNWVNAQVVSQLESRLTAGHVAHEIHRYPGTHHAFMNDARPEVHDAEAAKVAWGRVLEFLGKHVGK